MSDNRKKLDKKIDILRHIIKKQEIMPDIDKIDKEDRKIKFDGIFDSSSIPTNIPQISVRRFDVKPLTELETSVNSEKVIENPLRISQVKLAEFTLTKLENLDTSILIGDKYVEEALLIPQLKLVRFKRILGIDYFETKFEVAVEELIKIPQLLLTKFERIQPYEKFLVDKPFDLSTETLFKEEIKEEKINVSSLKLPNKLDISEILQDDKITGDLEITESIVSVESEQKGYRFKDFDFIELLLGKSGKKILSGRPLCIIVERHPDKYEYIVATICREVYREKRGQRPPQPIPVRNVDDIDFEFKSDISDQIIIVEDAKYSEVLRKVLLKIPFSSLGFLILITDKPDELETMIRKNIPTAEEFLIRIEPTKLDESVKVKIVEFIKGQSLIKSYSFGENFLKAVNDFENTLARFRDYNRAPNELKVVWNKLMVKSPESSEHASEEHSAMKSFVWQYLWKKYKRTPKLEDEKGVDVSIDNENYEIETFYGCEDPIAKLTEKMEKFTQNDKIFFVLRNVSILIHLKDLISFKNTWKEQGYDVEIVGLDFKKKELISIKNVQALLRSKMNNIK